jgi:aminodeoxyfutalosine deaminase
VTLESYLRAAPKAELHLHLEGAILPETLLRLAARNHVALPADTVEGVRRWFVFRDFRHFVEVYVTITRCLRALQDYELIVAELGATLARQNARYAEVTFSPSTHGLVLGIPEQTFLDGLARGRERARIEHGVELSWIFDIVRDSREPEVFYPYVTRAAIQEMPRGVVALGLAGLETGGAAAPFVPWFKRAREAGLHCVPHAGELAGPAAVRAAIEELGGERVGHGVRAVEDPTVVRLLAERRVPLEVCPTSNLRLGVFPDLEAHPLRRLHDAGVPVTVNSDDPALFNTTLEDEIALLATAFGFTAAEVDQVDAILLNAVRHSFLPAERKQRLEGEFLAELERLKPLHL